MAQYIFQIYFIFVLSILFQGKLGFPDRHSLRKKVDFSLQKCVKSTCTCDAFVNVPDGVTCEEGSDQINTLLFKGPHSNLIAGMFEGLAILDLTLDDSDATIDENIFERMVNLTLFTVRRSRIEIIPNFSFVSTSIQNISIENSRLTSLEGRNLQNLPKVEYLSFRYNSLRTIDSDVFKGTENIKYLYLDHNQLTYIPANLLNPMKNLIEFQAQSNSLTHVDNLFSIKRPQSICLKNNTITNVSFALDHTNIECNHQLTEEATSDNIHHKNIDDSLKTIFSTIDLSYNAITESSLTIAPCCKKFKRRDCLIVTIQELKLTGNKLSNLGSWLRFTQIHSLQIDINNIQYLTAMDFKKSNKIYTLDLQKNEIRQIDTSTFINIRYHLKSLDLSFNHITSLNGSIKDLHKLEILNLENNAIQFFALEEFAGLEKLSYLYLQNNKLNTIKQLQKLHLSYLNIQYNTIKSIVPDHLPKTLTSLHFKGNLNCDCSIMPLIDKLKASGIETDGPCQTFGHTNKYENSCPNSCSCKCTKYKDVSFIAVDCSSKNLYDVPEISEIIRIYPYHRLRDLTLYVEDKVLGVNLDNNNLESLEGAGFPPGLFQLNVSNNRFKVFPSEIIENQRNLKQVTLSRNPWKCDCQAVPFKNFMKSVYILDLGNVICGISGLSELYGKAVWNLTDWDLCKVPTPRGGVSITYIIVFVGLTLLMIGLIAQIFYNKYARRYRLYRYVNGKATRRPVPAMNEDLKKWVKIPKY